MRRYFLTFTRRPSWDEDNVLPSGPPCEPYITPIPSSFETPFPIDLNAAEYGYNWDDWAGDDQILSPPEPYFNFSTIPTAPEVPHCDPYSSTPTHFGQNPILNFPLKRSSSAARAHDEETTSFDSSGSNIPNPPEGPKAPGMIRRRTPKTEDEVLFTCPIPNCGKTYRRKGDLKFHVIHKHPSFHTLPTAISRPKSDKNGKSFPCPVASCKCGFKWHRDLRRHFKAKHPQLLGALKAYEWQAQLGAQVEFDEKCEAKWRVLNASLSDHWTELEPSDPQPY